MTISNLNDLELYLEEFCTKMGFKAGDMPSIYKLNARLTPIEVPAFLKQYPAFKSFIELNQKYDLSEFEITGFSFSPHFENNTDVFKQLLDAIEDPFFSKNFMESKKLHQIGSCNSDIICISRGSPNYFPGEITYLTEDAEFYDDVDGHIFPLAFSYEQFLILAGNLDQIYFLGEDKSDNVRRSELVERFELLEVDKRYWPIWFKLL